jgi:hypothetical protein
VTLLVISTVLNADNQMFYRATRQRLRSAVLVLTLLQHYFFAVDTAGIGCDRQFQEKFSDNLLIIILMNESTSTLMATLQHQSSL